MTVSICDVGPRDGLQNESLILPPAVRADLVMRLATSGLRRIETASFVHPDRVPAMAGAEEVVSLVEREPGVSYAGLVLNARGYERLRTAGLDEARLAVACTETFSIRNSNVPRADAFAGLKPIVAAARADGIRVSVTLMVAFGCPFEGPVAPDSVVALAEQVVALAPDEIVLADTIGVAAPAEVRRLFARIVQLGIPTGAHLHDTRGTGVANCYAALDAGVAGLDCSAGGIGGCPFAPGATGNVATEDVVYALQRDGVDLGIDLDKLLETTAWLERHLDHGLPGRVHRAGPAPSGAA